MHVSTILGRLFLSWCGLATSSIGPALASASASCIVHGETLAQSPPAISLLVWRDVFCPVENAAERHI